VDLKRGLIRDIDISQIGPQKFILVLSEDGLASLDANANIVDFAQGGGQRLAAKNGRAYIAALGAGVRNVMISTAGKLTRVGQFCSFGEATDLAPEANNWLWVAEGDTGVRLYDMSNPGAPLLLLWLDEFAPASAIRLNGAQIVIGYGSRLAV